MVVVVCGVVRGGVYTRFSACFLRNGLPCVCGVVVVVRVVFVVTGLKRLRATWWWLAFVFNEVT